MRQCFPLRSCVKESEDLEPGDEVAVLPCGHAFCEARSKALTALKLLQVLLHYVGPG